MNWKADHIPYGSTGYFSKIVIDYIHGSAALEPFYAFAPDIDGIKKAIAARKNYHTDRTLLQAVLKAQYTGHSISSRQQLNIDQLGNSNCFTVTTAHQPNIFTGHLYFIYKILHAVKLAEELTKAFPENDFVPVFYMGSEDADLDELGHIYLFGEKYAWETSQTGAVGRMKVDKALVNMIGAFSGQLTVYPFGEALIRMMRSCYTEGVTIEQATFKLVNALFAEYGLIVLLPDNADLKKAFIPVVEKEFAEQFSHKAVEETAALFPKEYKVQASGRDINLFYLKDDQRERIEAESSKYKVFNSDIVFTKEEMIRELHQYPERFSANVILRPVFQEMILPNIAFIGGGGEIAYWLELKKVFEAVQVPFPALVLRNSFMIIEEKVASIAVRLGFDVPGIFATETELLNELVKRETTVQLSLESEKQDTELFYRKLKDTAGAVDITLGRHIESLQAAAFKKLSALEKKMLRAEKKKFEAQQRQLHKLKTGLFPNNGLQERIENFMPYYAKWGSGFIQMIYDNALALEQEFVVLTEQGAS